MWERHSGPTAPRHQESGSVMGNFLSGSIPGVEPVPGGENLPGGHHEEMFLFFSNRLGCFGSLMVSLVVSVILIAILTRGF
ncbi:hypothetical protein GCM10022223_06490 [Kineosporia mesophila]|uniref:Uncharacterized protein n=1 Tax=Kineosporia mesophila TaxID=566012 RepID=A0ABP6Z267_9ACTN